MTELKEYVKDAQNIVVAGHVAPDGDCVGSVIAIYRYIRKLFPEKKVTAYLENLPAVYDFLDPDNSIISNELDNDEVDLFIAADTSSIDRLGIVGEVFKKAKSTMVIDHHVSNHGYGQVNIIETPLSSACELIATLMAEEDIDKDIASAIYTGMVTDSGGFRFSATSRKTMNIAGMLMEKGIDHAFIMDRCMYSRTYNQAQLLGRALLESMLVMDGKCIITTVTKKMMDIYECLEEDTEGIVDQLRVTRGVEVAVFLRERGEQEYKVSLRSNSYIDVSRVAEYFDGGGHIRAAGFTMRGSIHDIVNNIMEQINLQM
ncbi:MAG: bifunctional oligoribonuclease/PAP phosphatase NrnA [Lachnospiraceae bacterium]|nr:bifunctional oligoribonuclease/PAP phosphatase NrnA [Lachnospiraceae bacterium]